MIKGDRLEDRLLDAIREASGSPAAAWAVRPQRIEGGSWADTFKIRLKGAPGLGGDLVARVLPEPDSFEREMLVQQYVAKTGFPAPQVHLGAPPTATLDRAWFLMDFDPGRRPIESFGRIRLLWAVVRTTRESPRMIARAMVAIHAIDAEPIARALAFPKVVGPVLDWLYSRASALADADLVDRAQRLLATRPRFESSVLCHGDLHPLNILRSPGRDTIIDWTHAQYDDPLYDLAFTWMAFTVIPVRCPGVRSGRSSRQSVRARRTACSTPTNVSRGPRLTAPGSRGSFASSRFGFASRRRSGRGVTPEPIPAASFRSCT